MSSIPLPPALQIIRSQLERTHPRGKHSALNAADGLDKAWALRNLDREMAVFRAITAEEESATALFHALKRRKYPGSNRLNPRDHLHKAALTPYLRAIIRETRESIGKSARFSFTYNPSRSDHGYTLIIQKADEARTQTWLQEELLAFTTKVDGEEADFLNTAVKLAAEEGAVSVPKYVKDRANFRNRALYAGERGQPRFRGHIEKYLLAMRPEVYRILLCFVIIDLERRNQEFVPQALRGFLKVLSELKKVKNLDGDP
jgi:hypothetical protein